MSTVITSTWTDNITVLANQTLALGANVRASLLDWRTKRGGFIFARVGRGGTTAITAGISVKIRRVINGAGASTAQVLHPAAVAPLIGGTTTAVSTTCAAAGNNAGATSLTVASTTSFAVGGYFYINGAGSGNKEFCGVSKVTSATVLLLDAPLQNAHNSASDLAISQADVFVPVWVDGGSYIEVVVDYGSSTTGQSVTIEVFAQSYDSDLST